MREVTRRELLASLLGTPLAAGVAGLAASGCRSRARPPLPEGEIIGLSDGLGHRLQHGFRPRPPAGVWQDVGVLIVGGGVAGLAAAWRLRHAGFSDFVLLELEADAGGTSRGGRSPVSAFPWAAHYLPAPQPDNRALLRLLDEMGVLEGRDPDGEPVVAEQFLCRDPQERIFFKGHWYEGLYLHAGASRDDLRQLDEFEREVDRWVAWRDGRGRRAFALPTSAASDDPEVRSLDRISMADFLARRGWCSPRLRWYVDYACRDDYGSFLADTSAWAGLFYFASRVPRPGEEAEPLITWPEGNGRLVEHLLGRVAPHVRLGVAATEIVPLPPAAYRPTRPTPPEHPEHRSRLAPPAGATTGPRPGSHRAAIEVTAFDRRARLPLGFRAERVIFAAPQYLARYLIRPFREQPPPHLAEFEYSPWMVANLTLRERPALGRGFPLAWDNVLYESPSLGYVVATHQTGVERGPTVLTYYYAFCDRDSRRARSELLAGDHSLWAELALADLSLPHPDIRELTTRLDVMRLGHAMVKPRTGFLFGGGRERAQLPHRGIHFAHSDLSGVALFEEAFDHGLRAAEEAMRAVEWPMGESYRC